MITMQEAYEKVFTEVYPDQYSPECIEDRTHYIFVPRPKNVKEDELYCTGSVYPAVNKQTGNIESFNILTDSLENAVSHHLEFIKSW